MMQPNEAETVAQRLREVFLQPELLQIQNRHG